MEHEHAWKDARPSSYPALSGDTKADVVIIGGGLTGIVSAYLLAKSGKNVVVLEANTLGQGATVHTTAFLTRLIDTTAEDLLSVFGPEIATEVFVSGQTAIDTYERIILDEKIDCQFARCPLIVYANTPRQVKNLQSQQKALARLGYHAALKYDDIGIAHKGYLEIPDQAKFHPMKFLAGLAGCAERSGVRFFEHTPAVSLTSQGSWAVKTPRGTVHTQDVIIATYNPFNKPKATKFKKAMYKSYVIQVDVAPGILKEMIATDVDNPYHYLRVDRGTEQDHIIFGGEDHRLDIPFSEKKSFQALKEHLHRALGHTHYTSQRQWTGHILESIDGLPFIGQIEKHSYVATAFSGNGMTYAMVAGLMFRDLITTDHSRWQKTYDPRRSWYPRRLLLKARDYTGALLGGGLKNTLHWSRKKTYVAFSLFAAAYLIIHYLIFDRTFRFTTVRAFLAEGHEHIWHVAPLVVAFIVLLVIDRIKMRHSSEKI